MIPLFFISGFITVSVYADTIADDNSIVITASRYETSVAREGKDYYCRNRG